MPKPLGIVFDWNGTLLDDIHIILKVKNDIFKHYGYQVPIELSDWQNTKQFPLRDIYTHFGFDGAHFDREAAAIQKQFLTQYMIAADICTLRPYTIELLQYLQTQNVVITLLSNHDHADVMRRLDNFNIKHYFATISANHDHAGLAHKTAKADRLKEILYTHNCAQWLLVGDSHEEPALAHEFDLLGCSITGGVQNEILLHSYQPHYLVHDLIEIEKIAESLLTPQ